MNGNAQFNSIFQHDIWILVQLAMSQTRSESLERERIQMDRVLPVCRSTTARAGPWKDIRKQETARSGPRDASRLVARRSASCLHLCDRPYCKSFAGALTSANHLHMQVNKKPPSIGWLLQNYFIKSA